MESVNETRFKELIKRLGEHKNAIEKIQWEIEDLLKSNKVPLYIVFNNYPEQLEELISLISPETHNCSECSLGDVCASSNNTRSDNPYDDQNEYGMLEHLYQNIAVINNNIEYINEQTDENADRLENIENLLITIAKLMISNTQSSLNSQINNISRPNSSNVSPNSTPLGVSINDLLADILKKVN